MDYNRLRGHEAWLESILMPTFLTTKIDYNRLLSMEPAGRCIACVYF